MANDPGSTLREALAARRALLVPGAANALSARIIADLGFEAVYLTGAGLTNMSLGVPDLGFISLPELVQATTAIRNVVDLPIIVDADTGFGNAINVRHTVRALERAGANAIQLEDQVFPKRCGHFEGKSILAPDEAVSKVKAAVDARSNENFLVVARTDARSVEGFNSAIDRAAAFIEAGADVTFVEAPQSREEIERIPRLLSVPQLINFVVGGKTPVMEIHDVEEMGYGLVLYANVALQGAVAGMQLALTELKSKGRLDEESRLLATFAERQRLVRKEQYDELEARYSNVP